MFGSVPQPLWAAHLSQGGRVATVVWGLEGMARSAKVTVGGEKSHRPTTGTSDATPS